MSTPRYRVVKHWHDTTETVGHSSKRRTAHRMCAAHEAGNLSHVAWYQVVDRDGRVVIPSGSRYRRERNRAQWIHDRSTVAARGVW